MWGVKRRTKNTLTFSALEIIHDFKKKNNTASAPVAESSADISQLV